MIGNLSLAAAKDAVGFNDEQTIVSPVNTDCSSRALCASVIRRMSSQEEEEEESYSRFISLVFSRGNPLEQADLHTERKEEKKKKRESQAQQ